MIANIYYFSRISRIGGIEQFFYELAKVYGNEGKSIDLVIYYDYADVLQLQRLKKYVDCRKREVGKKVICHRAFFNFNLDMINDVEADEYVLVVHGNYHMLDSPPPQHPKITRVIAVSKDSARAYTELTGIDCEVCYNPLSIENVQPVVKLVTACRLEDKVKGGQRTLQLIEALDRYAEANNRQYLFTIFTNSCTEIASKNVAIMQPRIDIRSYLADADYVVQLSDNFEGFCYTINEALMYKTPVVITPCNVFKELGINSKMAITLDFDCSNVDDVAQAIFTKNFDFEYKPPKDRWHELLYPQKSLYKRSDIMNYKVRALKSFENVLDTSVGRNRSDGEEFIVSADRYIQLANYPMELVEIVEEIAEEEPKKKTSKKK